jgi:hypothetical protein
MPKNYIVWLKRKEDLHSHDSKHKDNKGNYLSISTWLKTSLRVTVCGELDGGMETENTV